jgi:hypothetical protein
MITARANFLPEQRFLPLRPVLQEHLTKVGDAVKPENFLSICDEVVLKLVKDTFDRIGADEGSIWLIDHEKKALVASYNSGVNSAKVVGFEQPLSSGIISLVVASENAFIENEVYKHKGHDPKLGETIGKTTYAMIAVPLYFLNQVRGVISCVQLLDVVFEKGQAEPTGEKPPGFKPLDLNAVQTVAAAVRDLLDYRLLGTAVGWNRH